MTVTSPCTGICALDPTGRHCLGCHRTIEEIAGWQQGSDDWKRAVLSRLRGRLLKTD